MKHIIKASETICRVRMTKYAELLRAAVAYEERAAALKATEAKLGRMRQDLRDQQGACAKYRALLTDISERLSSLDEPEGSENKKRVIEMLLAIDGAVNKAWVKKNAQNI